MVREYLVEYPSRETDRTPEKVYADGTIRTVTELGRAVLIRWDYSNDTHS